MKNNENKEDIENLSNVQSIELKEHYVYELIDSRNNEVFYVGKGVEHRVEQHKKDAENNQSTEKLKRISDIELDDGKIIERILGRYDTDNEARAVEATLIKYIYGIDNLTNKVHGRGADTIRKKGDSNTIEGIDIPETKYEHSYVYTNENIENYEKYKVQKFMEDKKAELEKLTTLAFTNPEPQQAYKSVVIKHIIEPFEIHVLTNSNESEGIVVEVKPVVMGKTGREHITKLIKSSTLLNGLGYNKKDDTYSYTKLHFIESTESINTVAENINQYVSIINQYLDKNNK